jgi:hypothetical protein
VFATSSLDGAAREQYATMKAGGGAVAAPPPKKKGSSTTGQLQAAAAENRPGPFGLDFLFFFFFFIFPFFPHQKVFFPKKGDRAQLIRGQARKTRRPRPYGQGLRFLASQGKRDKNC